MSCPNWMALPPRDDAEDSPLWRVALAHFDGCEHCRDQAIAADPSLLFRRLPPVEVGTAEIDAMKLAVRNLRRAEAIERPSRHRSRGRWLQAAVLAALVAGAGWLAVDRAPNAPASFAEPLARAAAEVPALVLRPDLSHLPMVEEVRGPHGDVIQLIDDELAVVVVELPESHDV